MKCEEKWLTITKFATMSKVIQYEQDIIKILSDSINHCQPHVHTHTAAYKQKSAHIYTHTHRFIFTSPYILHMCMCV